MAYIQTANRTIERSPHVAAIGEINRLVKRAFDVAGRERARRVVETAVGTRTYSKHARRIVPSNGRLMCLRWVLIIEINRLVKRAFDVAGRESSSRCGDSSGDENMLQ